MSKSNTIWRVICLNLLLDLCKKNLHHRYNLHFRLHSNKHHWAMISSAARWWRQMNLRTLDSQSGPDPEVRKTTVGMVRLPEPLQVSQIQRQGNDEKVDSDWNNVKIHWFRLCQWTSLNFILSIKNISWSIINTKLLQLCFLTLCRQQNSTAGNSRKYSARQQKMVFPDRIG